MTDLNANLILEGTNQAVQAEPLAAEQMQSQIANAQKIGQQQVLGQQEMQMNALSIAQQQANLQGQTALSQYMRDNPLTATNASQWAQNLPGNIPPLQRIELTKTAMALQMSDLSAQEKGLQIFNLRQGASATKQQDYDSDMQAILDHGGEALSTIDDPTSKLSHNDRVAAATVNFQQFFEYQKNKAADELKNGQLSQQQYQQEIQKLQQQYDQTFPKGVLNEGMLRKLYGTATSYTKARDDWNKQQQEQAQTQAIQQGKTLVPVKHPDGSVTWEYPSSAAGQQVGAKPSASQPDFSPQENAVLAALQDKGGSSLISGFGGVNKMKTSIDAQLQAHPGDSPDQIADRIVTGHYQMIERQTEARVVGNRIGGLAIASHELNPMEDQVRQAAQAAGQSNWVVVNRLDQAMSNQVKGNPNRAKLFTAIQGLGNAYQQILKRGGVSTEGAREAAEKLISSITGVDAMNAVLDQMSTENGIAQLAAQAAMDDLTSGRMNKPGTEQQTPKSNKSVDFNSLPTG